MRKGLTHLVMRPSFFHDSTKEFSLSFLLSVSYFRSMIVLFFLHMKYMYFLWVFSLYKCCLILFMFLQDFDNVMAVLSEVTTKDNPHPLLLLGHVSLERLTIGYDT